MCHRKEKAMETKPIPVLTEDCPCTRNCPRHGNCVECVKNHRYKVPGVPACFFSPEGEKAHDRSFQALFRDKGLLK